MEYKIECRLNRESPGNYDMIIIDGDEEILIPCLDPKVSTIEDLENAEAIDLKYSTTIHQLDHFDENCIVVEYNIYPTNPDFPITPFDIINALGRWEGPDKPYDMSVSMGRGFGSHSARERIVGAGCYVVPYDSSRLMDFSIKTYEDFKKDLPEFDLKRYIEFWDKYDAAFEKFTSDVPDWFKK